MNFLGRSLTVINDFSVEEQLFLYEKTKLLKQLWKEKKDTSKFQIKKDVGIYIIFVEPSTRTKESFINAAKFHKNAKVNIFDSEHSSFNKKESYVDTFNMLTGYSNYSIFIVRTKLEGTCKYLDEKVYEFTKRHGLEKPSFINAGDGKHEHPTQELLDEFTFLEQLNFDNSYIHIALVGDLLHGRTVHSKANGLKIFKNVLVDLIAPEELSMPIHYVEKMKKNGFEIRLFDSIENYLKNENIAPIWYFTRLQLERMGEDILEKEHVLRNSVTFRKEFLEKLPKNVKFYHPLPRHKMYPTIPTFLDTLPLNGWEEQAINGYWTRTVLLSMLGGALETDLSKKINNIIDEQFIIPANITNGTKGILKEGKRGIKPIENGTVIDHIAKGKSKAQIYETIIKIRKILKLYDLDSTDGIFKSQDGNFKGYISLPDRYLSKKEIKKLSAISPNTTVNIIKNSKVVEKYRISLPPYIYGFAKLKCKNENCITNPTHGENAEAFFIKNEKGELVCKYCETPHTFEEIWNI
ncbi:MULTISPECIES: bifunctional aspartate carbamoyltransferase catalytic subunit/aspartate carbamoyltransferase regulatory subunit [unclassified Thermosipho (in: thermotogales)]|uniref:bifunctional aspartate carbamoyltransferase catalytic subunit/aspartate carbamoyltransferase regulatory subunit n=1 Tax=unclassified Thermosipho (in: thermotogales) TaxID=2676525 RepID=UPI000984A103|nr:bifunctional aspartate carbamoyltransferase catalytic subunit/aspartate carbamoyltransferase regulatory subunit [Thermosipho sp. 1223]MBT1248262.1 bifunctional aspartate carbamoyltransferase catalytic subunit/aspartate carbamoyltransferase regulatory subunit [Thermosipho sp. 1244]OOC46520.1 bifunctional aspartate carbamoyltransferase catalytic subunit/aspartate carbamoyltransferase regulatory subunit [Thermosipho sp. 1223]